MEEWVGFEPTIQYFMYDRLVICCNQPLYHHSFLVADEIGFEPMEPFSSTVFKTAAIDHSATHPVVGVGRFELP